ncbi:hypothetical protein N0O92_17345 [Alkalihalobacillus sp. MEB130]|uniref:hypothetical protein n=1 Tax=Alkalihalobacillus sp. MEB130 TaxID=2976704 RepID=UPI0028DD51FA|nr:hypothetical protein [Alkalihalobacillus sp. MEB130]MDT8861977.1 hypothetical protein [Alkalihalobacillus sp. MEB130]
MNKQKIGTIILTSSLVLGMSTGVMAKGPSKTPASVSNPVVQEDGRNTNGLETAQITFSPITGYFGTSKIVFGEVIIDGARDDLANLFITVGGKEITNVWAIPGQTNTYGFSTSVSLDSHSLTNVEVKAETKFHNGQKAGLVHSNNSSTVDVDVWATITKYSVDYGSESPNFVWDAETGTYELSFDIVKALSNGETEKEEITLTGLIPNSTLNYTSDELSDENFFGESVTLINSISVPAAPSAPVAENVVVTSISDLTLALEAQGQNQFKVIATYTLNYSDGTSKKVVSTTLDGGNIANPTTQNQNSSTREYTIGGIVYEVTVTYDSVTKTNIVNGIKK